MRTFSRSIRWIQLLLVILVLFTASHQIIAQDDENDVVYEEAVQHEEEVATEEVIEEPAVVEEVPPQVEEVVAVEEEPVVEEAAPTFVPPKEKTIEVDETPSSIKKASGSLVDSVVTKSKSVVECSKEKVSKLIDRIKTLDKNDAKKVAAAALGIWGVSVGVGWLAGAGKK